MSDDSLPPLFLASQSPRRKQLLETLGLAFEIVISPVEEAHPETSATVDGITVENAVAKASAALASIADDDAIVLGADTLVVLGDEAIGKPADAVAAEAILKRLSARTHTVVTGMCLLSRRYGKRVVAARTEITFRELAQGEITDYLKTPEPYDKAGAYAIQGQGSLFIAKVEGSYTNVMGLPIEALLAELPALTGISLYRWFLK